MQGYKDYISDLAKNEKPVVFFNSGPDHAALVMENIFRYTDKKIKIFAGNLSGKVSNQDNYKAGIMDLWERGGNFQILLQSHKLTELAEDPPLFKLLRYFKSVRPESVEIKKDAIKVVDGDNEIHFTTGDGKMYRIENNTDSYSATGNFNDPVTVEKLNNLFDSLFIKADSIELQIG